MSDLAPHARRSFGWKRVCLGLVLASLASPASAEDSTALFRAKLEKWVEARQIASAESSDWEADRETLEATRDLLRRERSDLREAIAEFEAEGASVDDERRALLGRRDELQRSNVALAEKIAVLETRVLELAERLPDPLRKKLDLLLVQIPEDPATTKVATGQRLMNVLGVLAQAEKFNNTATLVGETRQVGGGEERVQVRTVYWGLGQAVYVDKQGGVAGIGRPTAEGPWAFVDDPALAAEAKLFLDIYEGNVDTIAFVPIPVDID